MKKVFIAVLAIATMTSCSKETGVVENSGNGQIPVRLSAGVNNVVVTKAAINPGDNFDAQFVASTTLGNYTTSAWDTEAEITNNAVTLATPQYYPIDGSMIYMKGFAPAAQVTDGNIDYTLTGAEDIMVTGEVSGDKTNTTPVGFVFNHKLTQLKFKVIAENATYPTGVTVKGITVNGTKTATSLNLSNGNLTFSGAAVTLPVFTNGTYAVNTTGIAATEVLLVEPGATMTLDVVLNDGTNDIPFTAVPVTLTSVAGNSHLITLTFKNTTVTATATVAPWTDGATGDVEIG